MSFSSVAWTTQRSISYVIALARSMLVARNFAFVEAQCKGSDNPKEYVP
jgi:hypothetical protein